MLFFYLSLFRTDEIRYSWWFHLFSVFWICAFLSATNQFVLASCASIWYFNQGKDGANTKGEVTNSFYRAFRYHLGSLALGSLIVAIIQFIIACLEYVKTKLDDAGAQKSKIYKCMISCLECCLYCILKCVEFINKHAYIQVRKNIFIFLLNFSDCSYWT